MVSRLRDTSSVPTLESKERSDLSVGVRTHLASRLLIRLADSPKSLGSDPWAGSPCHVNARPAPGVVRGARARFPRAIDPSRSEERRVGKECRSRWSAYP